MSAERGQLADRIRSRLSSAPFRPTPPPHGVRRTRRRTAIYSAWELLEAAERRGWPVEEVAEELFDLQRILAHDLYTATLVRRELEEFLARHHARPHTNPDPSPKTVTAGGRACVMSTPAVAE
jgi:hypothetical protein